jgi:hypothetical protein
VIGVGEMEVLGVIRVGGDRGRRDGGMGVIRVGGDRCRERWG